MNLPSRREKRDVRPNDVKVVSLKSARTVSSVGGCIASEWCERSQAACSSVWQAAQVASSTNDASTRTGPGDAGPTFPRHHQARAATPAAMTTAATHRQPEERPAGWLTCGACLRRVAMGSRASLCGSSGPEDYFFCVVMLRNRWGPVPYDSTSSTPSLLTFSEAAE